MFTNLTPCLIFPHNSSFDQYVHISITPITADDNAVAFCLYLNFSSFITFLIAYPSVLIGL